MKFCAIAACLVLLSACASVATTVPDPAALALLKSGKSSALVFNIRGDMVCDYSFVGVYHPGAEKNDVVTTLREAGYQSSTPVVLAVPPGRYRLAGASCLRSGYYPSTYPALASWFGWVEVRPDEVVYLGTIDARLVDFKTASAFDNAFARFLFATPDDTRSAYVAYTIGEDPEVKERVSAQFPEVSRRMVYRPLPQLISTEAYVAALKEAFAPGPDGAPPTAEAGRAKLRAILDARFGAPPSAPGSPAAL